MKYKSKVDWHTKTDYLRCNLKFSGCPQYDCILANYQQGAIFTQLVFVFVCWVSGREYHLALIQPLEKKFVIAHLFHNLYLSFSLPFPPLYPTSLPSFPFHALTTNDKTIKHDDIGTWWPSNTWWPKELLDRMLHRPKNIQRSAPYRPLLRRDLAPHQAGDSWEESPWKPMPPLPTWARSSPEPAATNSTSPAKGRRSCIKDQ